MKITEKEIKAKVKQLGGLVTKRGAKKILNHIKKNEKKYGKNIYKDYYKRFNSVKCF